MEKLKKTAKVLDRFAKIFKVIFIAAAIFLFAGLIITSVYYLSIRDDDAMANIKAPVSIITATGIKGRVLPGTRWARFSRTFPRVRCRSPPTSTAIASSSRMDR